MTGATVRRLVLRGRVARGVEARTTGERHAEVMSDHRRLAQFGLMVSDGSHPLGTARADAWPTHGVVDANLDLHDAAGVDIADGSAVPSALGVNPQLTIMALATRLAHGVLGRAGAQPSGPLHALAG